MTFADRFNYIAFYDLDHTILKGNSATTLVEVAREREIMSSRQFRHALYLSVIYKLNLGNSTKMINRMLSWLKGLEEASIRRLCSEVFNNQLVETIRPEILQSLDKHRNENAAVVLLSSASLPVCEPVSKYLNMDETICTRLESINGILTGHTLGKLVYGKEKKEQLLAFCETHGHDPKLAYYYGDSYTDQHVMEAVGNPVAVSPDKKLLRIASARNWQILVHDR
ncbi:MAG: HAD-IB family hydrolase [Bacteroidota bacterium]